MIRQSSAATRKCVNMHTVLVFVCFGNILLLELFHCVVCVYIKDQSLHLPAVFNPHKNALLVTYVSVQAFGNID